MQFQSAYWLVAYWVNADFNSLKAARRCFLSSSSRFRSSCSAFISASNLLAEERAWAFMRQRENKWVSSLASEGEPKPELLPDEQHRTTCCTSQCLLGSSVRTAQALITLQCLGIYTQYLLLSLTLTSTKERSHTNKSQVTKTQGYQYWVTYIISTSRQQGIGCEYAVGETTAENTLNHSQIREHHTTPWIICRSKRHCLLAGYFSSFHLSTSAVQ